MNWTGDTVLDKLVEAGVDYHIYWGVRTAAELPELPDAKVWGEHLTVVSDDGSVGPQGFPTDQAFQERTGKPCQFYGCGPNPLLASLSRLAGDRGVQAEVSLESVMCCGIGICLSCVMPFVEPDGSTAPRPICINGPIVECSSIRW